MKAPDFRVFLSDLDRALSVEVLRLRTSQDGGGTSGTVGEMVGDAAVPAKPGRIQASGSGVVERLGLIAVLAALHPGRAASPY
jgi:hypothetical protein